MRPSLSNEPTISCPKCRASFKLTESLAAPMLAHMRKRFEHQLAGKRAEFDEREVALRKAQAALRQDRKAIKVQVSEKLQAQRKAIAIAEARKARLVLAADLKQRDRQLADLEKHLKANNAKLAEAQKSQSMLVRKARQLDDAKREIDLSIQKQVQQSLEAVRRQAKAEAEAALKQRVTEKELQISGMNRQIEDLKRKSEQGSQQLQGEALEVDLEALLRQRFPHDIITPVPVGGKGGDILQTVITTTGVPSGLLLWETKRTKRWRDQWIAKLREDQRRANASSALLVTTALPHGIDSFDLVDGIWVAKPAYAMPLATAIRQLLIELETGKMTFEGQRTKTELIYKYLTGHQFRHRMEAIVEHFSEMQADLQRERKATLRLWAKREGQLRGVIEASAGLYGDVQGIAGQALPNIQSLEILAIDTDALPSDQHI